MSKDEMDLIQLRAALALVRDRCPGAVAVELETSDQNKGYGFVINVIEYESGVIGPVPDEIEDAIWERLNDIDWDGVVNESPQGYARISLLEEMK